MEVHVYNQHADVTQHVTGVEFSVDDGVLHVFNSAGDRVGVHAPGHWASANIAPSLPDTGATP